MEESADIFLELFQCAAQFHLALNKDNKGSNSTLKKKRNLIRLKLFSKRKKIQRVSDRILLCVIRILMCHLKATSEVFDRFYDGILPQTDLNVTLPPPTVVVALNFTVQWRL